MNTIVQILRKHPVTLTFYVIYLLIILQGVVTNYQEQLGGLLLYFVATIFILAMCINAVARSNDQVWFYLLMVVLVAVPIIIISRH